MSLRDDAGKILIAIASYEVQPGDEKKGRHNLTGAGVVDAIQAMSGEKLQPDRINDAVSLLEGRGLVAVRRYLGTAPFNFGGVEVTAQGRLLAEEQVSAQKQSPELAATDPRKVFVIHGRDEKLREAMFTFLRCINLKPIEWSQARALTGKASPYVGEILEKAFDHAQAVVALLTGDDEARLREHLSQGKDEQLVPQARPNVLFEAGMAMGSHADRTVFVEIGDLRPFSDIAGRHTIRLAAGLHQVAQRQELANRLRDAGCEVDISGTDWHVAGDFF